MARVTHSTDHLLDCARDVLLARGARATTVSAIAEQAGAPTGSIYHRFKSVDEMLARAWLRAVRGTQSVRPDGTVDAVSIALANYDHCLANPRDVLLLDTFRLRDVANLSLDDDLRDEIARANADSVRLLRALGADLLGGTGATDVDLLTLAVVDLPFAFAQRYLRDGDVPSRARRDRLPAAVRAVLDRACYTVGRC